MFWALGVSADDWVTGAADCNWFQSYFSARAGVDTLKSSVMNETQETADSRRGEMNDPQSRA